MATTAETTDGGAEEQENVAVDMRRVKPPNKKKHDEDVEEIMASIRRKEAELASLQSSQNDSLPAELKTIRTDKDTIINKRKKIDEDLRLLNQEIKKQMDMLNRYQSNLQYKREDKIDEAIRRLEHQLCASNFRLSEERKIVSEIDNLRRSKKTLGQYVALKKEIDGMRDRQRKMREERDHLYKSVTHLKTREEELKKKNASSRMKSSEVKKEIDQLYEKKRKVFAEFKKQERDFQESREEARKRQRQEISKKREEDRRANLEAYQKELAEYEASREPYEDEIQLCSTLTTYLQRTYLSPSEGSSSSDALPDTSGQAEPPQDFEQEGLYVLKKKKDDDNLFGGIGRAKGNKRSKREKRKSLLNKPIVHTPEIFQQFASLSLKAPATMTEVPLSIQALEEQQKYYESLKQPIIQVGMAVPDGSSSGGSAPSITESFISDSVLSTPEVQDNSPPSFPQADGLLTCEARPRRLSHDSGACELEDHNSSDECITQSDDIITKNSDIICTADTVKQCDETLGVQMDDSCSHIGGSDELVIVSGEGENGVLGVDTLPVSHDAQNRREKQPATSVSGAVQGLGYLSMASGEPDLNGIKLQLQHCKDSEVQEGDALSSPASTTSSTETLKDGESGGDTL